VLVGVGERAGFKGGEGGEGGAEAIEIGGGGLVQASVGEVELEGRVACVEAPAEVVGERCGGLHEDPVAGEARARSLCSTVLRRGSSGCARRGAEPPVGR
jgi:hypothetical protein